jgi:hypothetical protein
MPCWRHREKAMQMPPRSKRRRSATMPRLAERQRAERRRLDENSFPKKVRGD